jgi:hypothetical protein
MSTLASSRLGMLSGSDTAGLNAARLASLSRRSTGQEQFSDILAQASSSARSTGGPDSTPEDRARRAAEQFVSIALLQPLLKEFRQSSQAAPPFAPSQGEKQFQSLIDAATAERMVQASNFPVVDRVARDLLQRAQQQAAARAASQQKDGHP